MEWNLKFIYIFGKFSLHFWLNFFEYIILEYVYIVKDLYILFQDIVKMHTIKSIYMCGLLGSGMDAIHSGPQQSTHVDRHHATRQSLFENRIDTWTRACASSCPIFASGKKDSAYQFWYFTSILHIFPCRFKHIIVFFLCRSIQYNEDGYR